MSLRFVSPGAISCACEEVRAPAFVAGWLLLMLGLLAALMLLMLGLLAALMGWPRTAGVILAVCACCAGVSIGALLVERRFR